MIGFRDRMARGHTRTGWLDSRHAFAFGNHADPEHPGFRTMRVLNEDRIIPGSGFAAHDHHDMEILTWVLDGAVEHRDSLGSGATVRAGELQRMSAGTGIRHSEANPSPTASAHLLQIWIHPDRPGLAPGYEQKAFPPEGRRDRFQLIAAREGGDAVSLHQDALISVADLTEGRRLDYPLATGRGAWLQVTGGIVALNGTEMREGDGAAVEDVPVLEIEAETEASVMVIDLG
jgi:redox-sensitive bicupin YhaK (pirin superfamily)